MNRSFSFASVVLSYFLVGGGMFAGLLLAVALKVDKEMVLYALMGAGAAVGGFVAARASLGSTIIEPAIGAVCVVATIVGIAAGTEAGRLVWHVAPEATAKFVGTVGGFATVGAIVGASVSEKLFSEPSTSSAPWLVYSAFATFGASLLATAFVALLATGAKSEAEAEVHAVVLLAGIGAGCLLAGIAGGASARVRALAASFLGGGAGIAGFAYLVTKSAGVKTDNNTLVGFIVFAVGGAILTLIGTAIGWVTVGKRNA